MAIFDVFKRGRRDRAGAARRRSRPRIESLEDRRVPATWGVAWPDPQHLTASFVPDGTQAQGKPTQLFQALDSQLGAGKWEGTILSALQAWAANSNINIATVADGGQPLGVAGPAQGDARFGDIRISAEPLPADVVAITSPYDPATGTTSGDMILNSSCDFNPADPGSYDLSAVALHEAGHIFGFADSADPSSFMYDVYRGPQAGLAPGAIPALQALYGGPRSINAVDNYAVRTNPAHPAGMQNLDGGHPSVTASGDLASPQESDYFALKLPAPAVAPQGVDVQVQTAGISLLTPRVIVRDASGNVVASASASGPLDGGVSVHLNSLPNANDTIQVQGATGDALSVGSYDLTVSATMSAANPANATGGAHAIPQPGGSSSPLVVASVISQKGQSDLYSFKAPSAALLGGLTLNLQEWGFGLQKPSLRVLDALGNAVASASAPDAATPDVGLRVGTLVPNATYYVLAGTGAVNARSYGTYQLTLAFAPPRSAAFGLAVPYFGDPGANVANPNANTTLNAAAQLKTPRGEAPNSRYFAIQGVDAAHGQQFYSLQAPHYQNNQSGVMTVSVQALDTGMLPWIGVLDGKGNAVNARVLVEQDGTAVVQVPVTSAGANYVLEVSAAAGGGAGFGNYALDVTFGTAAGPGGPVASGTLPAAASGSPTAQASAPLEVDQSGLFSFVLAGDAANAGSDAVLTMTILDASGDVVATLSTQASLAASVSVCLAQGDYTILVGATSPSGRAIPALDYTLSATNLTDPTKVYPTTGSGGATPAR